jgi:hypothetical protein
LGTPQTVCNMAVIHYDIIHYDITYCTQLEWLDIVVHFKLQSLCKERPARAPDARRPPSEGSRGTRNSVGNLLSAHLGRPLASNIYIFHVTSSFHPSIIYWNPSEIPAKPPLHLQVREQVSNIQGFNPTIVADKFTQRG